MLHSSELMLDFVRAIPHVPFAAPLLVFSDPRPGFLSLSLSLKASADLSFSAINFGYR